MIQAMRNPITQQGVEESFWPRGGKRQIVRCRTPNPIIGLGAQNKPRPLSSYQVRNILTGEGVSPIVCLGKRVNFLYSKGDPITGAHKGPSWDELPLAVRDQGDVTRQFAFRSDEARKRSFSKDRFDPILRRTVPGRAHSS